MTMCLSLFSGCGNSESNSSGAGSENTAAQESGGASDSQASDTASEAGTSAEGETGASGGSAYNVTWDDMAEVNMVYMCMSAVPSGLQEVEDAINEITEAEINTHVNLEMIETGNYLQQVSLKMSAGEQVDILVTYPGGSAHFTAMATQGQLMDITDLLETYGQPILDTVGDYLGATTIDGAVMALPINADVVGDLYMNMRTDVLEDLGLLEQAEQIQCLADLEPILKAVKESDEWSYLSGLGSNGGNGGILIYGGGFAARESAEDAYIFDALGSSNLVGADIASDTPEVELVMEMPEYRETIELTHRWYEEGYIYKDAATDSTMASELVRGNKLFAYLSSGNVSASASASASCGMSMTSVKLASLPITTGSYTKFAWAVPSSAKYPEAAITFLSMMYTDSRISNLLAWGIEGRDYVVEDGVAKYPDGNESVPYHSGDTIIANQFITLPWDGNSSDIRELQAQEMESAIISPYLGFNCNTDAITNEIAAITNISAEYESQVTSGIVDVIPKVGLSRIFRKNRLFTSFL